MGYVNYNSNPDGKLEDDCVFRALAKVLGMNWNDVYMELTLHGFMLKSKPDKNYVWGSYLKRKGYQRYIIPNTCPDCYSVAEFAYDNPNGSYVVATDGHVVAVENGNYYDIWDSGKLVPLYYWKKETNNAT